MVNVQSFGDRHTGRRRKNNEDFVAWFEPVEQAEIEASGCLYILADGVGGADKGERASQYAAQKVLHEYYQHPNIEPADRLRQLMMQASDDIFMHAEQNGHFKRMATTMVAAIIHTGKLIIANVGDSRAYLIREGVATQLTRDHSVVGEMVANGDMTEEEAQVSKIKNRITRSIGGDADVHVDLYKPRSLQPGDKILLCSDGLTRYASREDIAQLTAEGSPKEIVERLIRFANQYGGADNISAILIAFGVVEALEPTIRIQRRPLPPSIEDTLDTIPDFRPRSRRTPSLKVWISVFVGMLIIIAIVVVGLLNLSAFPDSIPLFSSTDSLIQTSTPRIVEQTITPPTDTIQSAQTEENGNAQIGELPATTITPQVPQLCVIEVTENDLGISYYLMKYGLEFDFSETYYNCLLDSELLRCQDKKPIALNDNDEPIIYKGNWIVMSAVNNDITCKEQETARWVIDLSQ